MREFSVTAYRRLAERVDVALLVAETSDGAHMNVADFIASGAAGYVRTSAQYKGGITGAMRIAHLADSFQLRAEVHGSGHRQRTPVHGHPEHLVLRVPRLHQPGRPRARGRPGRDGSSTHRTRHRIRVT